MQSLRTPFVRAALAALVAGGLTAAPVLAASGRGHAEFTLAGAAHARPEIVTHMVDAHYAGKPLYRVILSGATTAAPTAVHRITLLIPAGLPPGTYSVTGALSAGSPVHGGAGSSAPRVGASYACRCEHHDPGNTYQLGPAHGRFVVTSSGGGRLSAHFRFTQQTPDGSDRVSVQGKLAGIRLEK